MTLAVAHVGGNNTSPVGATSDSWTSVAGSLIVAVGHTFDAPASAAAGDMTDSKSNTYTLAISLYNQFSVGIGVWYSNAATRGSSHTVTYNPPGGGGEADNLAVIEITGQDTGAAYDTATDATVTYSTPWTPFNITAAAAITGNQIAIYGVTLDDSSGVQAWGEPSGYSTILNNPSSAGLVCIGSYKLLETGTPTVGATRVSSATAAGIGVFATFKEAVPPNTPLWRTRASGLRW